MNSKLFVLALSLAGSCLWQSTAEASETRSKFENYLLIADEQKFSQALPIIEKLLAESPKDELYIAERGRMRMNLEKYRDAIEDCSRALAINPKDFQAMRTRAYCYFMVKDLKNGIKDTELLLKYSQPDFINMWPHGDHENLERAYTLIGRRDLAQKEQPLAQLDQLTERGVQARDRASMNAALAQVNQVLTKDPKHLNALGFKGLCLNNLTKFKESVEVLSKALSQRPNCPALLYLRADCYHELKQYQDAISDYNKIISMKPRVVLFRYATHTGRLRDKFSHTDDDCVNLPDIYFLRGNCYEALKLNDLAIADYTKVLELDKMEYKTASTLGSTFYNMRDYKEAIKFYSKALTINPKYWEAYTLRSRAYEQVNDTEKALGDLTTVISQNPKDAGAYALRASIYKRSKQYQKAVDDFSKMIADSPTDDEGYRERADCLIKLGEYDRAIKDYDQALKFNSEDKDAIQKSKSEALDKIGKAKKQR